MLPRIDFVLYEVILHRKEPGPLSHSRSLSLALPSFLQCLFFSSDEIQIQIQSDQYLDHISIRFFISSLLLLCLIKPPTLARDTRSFQSAIDFVLKIRSQNNSRYVRFLA